jgi:hypothetical protein
LLLLLLLLLLNERIPFVTFFRRTLPSYEFLVRTKFGVSQTVLLTARTLEPRKELLRQLINEEIGYVANLAILVQVRLVLFHRRFSRAALPIRLQQYHHALRDDPALKKDLGIDIDEHLFSKADSLWMEHSGSPFRAFCSSAADLNGRQTASPRCKFCSKNGPPTSALTFSERFSS